jgi:hypothetical protein
MQGFFIARVDKITIAITKLVDTVFDSGENLAVPWHIYNYRYLRLLLVMKMAYILDMEILVDFWTCLMEKNRVKAYDTFKEVLTRVIDRIGVIPGERARTIIFEAIEWAIAN